MKTQLNYVFIGFWTPQPIVIIENFAVKVVLLVAIDAKSKPRVFC